MKKVEVLKYQMHLIRVKYAEDLGLEKVKEEEMGVYGGNDVGKVDEEKKADEEKGEEQQPAEDKDKVEEVDADQNKEGGEAENPKPEDIKDKDEVKFVKKADFLYPSIKKVHITFLSMETKNVVERLFWQPKLTKQYVRLPWLLGKPNKLMLKTDEELEKEKEEAEAKDEEKEGAQKEAKEDDKEEE